MKLNRSMVGTLCLMAALVGCGSDADTTSKSDETSEENGAVPGDKPSKSDPAPITASDAGTEIEDPEVESPDPEIPPDLSFEGITEFPAPPATPTPPPAEDPGPPKIVPPDLGAPTLADQDRANLIKKLLEDSAYAKNWYAYFEPQAIQRPLIISPSHGNQVRVFQNDVAREATEKWAAGAMNDPLTMPTGSVIVKETFKLNTTTNAYDPNGIVIMAKVEGLDPAAYEGGWFFMRLSAANEASRSTTCVNCHNGRAQKTLWPVNPSIPMDPGGKANALVAYDYLFGAFCHDPDTAECDSPK